MLLLHAVGDGDHVRVHTGIEGVWEAAVLAHERDAFTRHVLDGHGLLEDRLVAWRDDAMEGEAR
ncbi:MULTISPECIES: hypothetical protein [Streptomyces]|uniref:hypothetical protein n=1 Tax=Streptomyces TaxID=1883 RepID=UPI001F206176|nr:MULTISPECIES: hypothetical protein [Streptomyces]